MEKKVFDIARMSELTGLSEAEIKFRLNIPLEETCQADTLLKAKNAYCNATSEEEELAALKRWIDLFTITTADANINKAIKLFIQVPPDPIAELSITKRIAYLLGFTDDYPHQVLFDRADNLAEAIEIAFKNFNNLSKNYFLGPKGKLKICRSGGDGATEEIFVKKAENEEKGRLLFIAYNHDGTHELSAHWEKDGETISKWNEEW